MPIHMNCPACGAGIKAPDQAAGRNAKCPKCGARVSIPADLHHVGTKVSASAPPPLPPGAPSQAPVDSRVSQAAAVSPTTGKGVPTTSYPRCKVCDQGTLRRTKKFRMSGVVVAIGFLLLVPSILGILFSVLVLFSGGAGSIAVLEATKKKIGDDLTAIGVPKATVEKVITSETIPGADLAKLKQDQQHVVSSAQQELSAGMAASGIAGVAFVGTSVCIGISSFIGGLLGWLLVMRKKVLQCDFCGAVLAAS